MKIRALVTLAFASTVLAGCGSSPMRPLGMVNAAGAQRAHDVAGDPAPFLDSAKAAFDMVNKQPNLWRNAVLVSIEGRGLDQTGRLVPALSGSWTFKFWANKVEDGRMETTFSRVDVIRFVETKRPMELLDGGEQRDGEVMRALDPAKLSPPTDVVPFAIRLGLKVTRSGPAFNYYDVVYNSFYANPSEADANVADVTSFYQRDTFDMLHIPADAGLLPKPGAPVTPAAPPAPAAKAGTKPAKATSLEIANDEAKRNGRQHI